jgi:hypothetical protein
LQQVVVGWSLAELKAPYIQDALQMVVRDLFAFLEMREAKQRKTGLSGGMSDSKEL